MRGVALPAVFQAASAVVTTATPVRFPPDDSGSGRQTCWDPHTRDAIYVREHSHKAMGAPYSL